MTIGEKIKALRKAQDVTQEQLADYLNIAPQSVSKWENNNALPDISLAVPLANFFGVSLDELFDRDTERQAAEIEEYDEKELTLANKGYIAERIVLWREAVRKYPRNYHCLSMLAHALFHTFWCGGYEDDFEKNAKEVVDICERLLRDCTDNNIRNSAIQLLVFTHSAKDLPWADEKKAEEYANMAGDLYTCREVLLESAYYTPEGKRKARKQQHANNLSFMDMLTRNIYLTGKAPAEEREFACETALKLWNTLIYDGNFLFYHCRIVDIYYYLAKSQIQLGKIEETLESLRQALYHAQKADEQPGGKQHYTSVFVSAATSDSEKCTKNYTETETELVLNRMTDSAFDRIRDDPRFIALLKK